MRRRRQAGVVGGAKLESAGDVQVSPHPPSSIRQSWQSSCGHRGEMGVTATPCAFASAEWKLRSTASVAWRAMTELGSARAMSFAQS